MSKGNFKKFYRNNRIYCILMLVSFICIVAIGTSLILYFVKQTKADEYGSRLSEINNYPVDDEIESIDTMLKSNELVTSKSVRVQGRIIYILVNVSDSITKEEAENLCIDAAALISEENQTYYDVQFIVVRPSYDSYFGSKSANSTMISWNNIFDTEANTTEEEE